MYYSLFMHVLLTFFIMHMNSLEKNDEKKESLNQVNEQLEQEGSESSSLTHC